MYEYEKCWFILDVSQPSWSREDHIQPLAFPVDPHLGTSYAPASSGYGYRSVVVTACIWEPVLAVMGKHWRTERVSLPPSTPNCMWGISAGLSHFHTYMRVCNLHVFSHFVYADFFPTGTNQKYHTIRGYTFYGARLYGTSVNKGRLWYKDSHSTYFSLYSIVQ